MIKCYADECRDNDNGVCDDSLHDVVIDWDWYGHCPACLNFKYKGEEDDEDD